MIKRGLAQRNSFPNMLIQASSAFIVPSVSGCLSFARKKPYDSSREDCIFHSKKYVTLASNFKLTSLAQSTNFIGFLIVKDVLNLRKLHQCKPSCFYISSMAASALQDRNSGLRMTRSDRSDAQKALFDYLHFTRCLSFTDAEHISKNSPAFVQSLLAKVKDGEKVQRSVAKFLRFAPINEFEPFFESLGLKPSELFSLLPYNLIYLTDDDLLIMNYHALCHYGVPRSKIGRMYKDGSEIFRYECGVLNLKLQSYEGLGLSKPTVIKLVTCCPTLLIGDINMNFIHVLRNLKMLEVELDLIRGCLSDKSVYQWDRILKMLDFLVAMSCNQNELKKLIIEHPRFLFDDSGKKIYILVALLLKHGIKMSEILHLFIQYPQILSGNYVKYFLKAIYFLVVIGMDVGDIKLIVKTHPHVLGASSSLRPHIVMQRLNMSKDRLRDIIKGDPNQFTYLATKRMSSVVSLPKVENNFLKEKTDFLLRLGYVENSDEMTRALKKFRGRGDQLQERFDFLVKIGFDCHTAVYMIKSFPPVLNQSVDVLEKKITCLLNDLGYSLEALSSFPTFLCYNLEKIKLRFSMYHWLRENGTPNRASSTAALSTVLACSEKRFFKYFVDLHPEGPEEWQRLKRLSSSN